MNDCRKAMLGLYKVRFDQLEKSELRWLTFLDPRVGKWMSHLGPADTPRATNDLVQAMVVLTPKNHPAEEVKYRNRTPVQVSAEQHRNFIHRHMFGPDVAPIETTGVGTEC